jgi:Lon protease-like protein
MPMPLHIFEPRYRRMVSDALGGGHVIGMALLRPGWEPNYEGRPPVYAIAGAGVIEQCEPLDDGDYNIVLRGFTRFRIAAERDDQPYRIAEAEALEDDESDAPALGGLREILVSALGRSMMEDLGLHDSLPHDLYVNALCQTLPMSPVERQALLECETLESRYLRLIETLEYQRLERALGSFGSQRLH